MQVSISVHCKARQAHAYEFFVSAIASKIGKLTSAAALLLSTASLNVKARLSRSYSTGATKWSMFRLMAFAKSQRGSHECRTHGYNQRYSSRRDDFCSIALPNGQPRRPTIQFQ